MWCVCVCMMMRVVEREGKVEEDKYRRESMQSEVIETCVGLVIYIKHPTSNPKREKEKEV